MLPALSGDVAHIVGRESFSLSDGLASLLFCEEPFILRKIIFQKCLRVGSCYER